jgi:hypothetical protein
VDADGYPVGIILPTFPGDGVFVELADPTGSWNNGVQVVTEDSSNIYVNGSSVGTYFYTNTAGGHFLFFYQSGAWYKLNL